MIKFITASTRALLKVDAGFVTIWAPACWLFQTGLTLAQAKEELRKERRIALALRGLSFYDARRLYSGPQQNCPR
jgi:hypothetical protein